MCTIVTTIIDLKQECILHTLTLSSLVVTNETRLHHEGPLTALIQLTAETKLQLLQKRT